MDSVAKMYRVAQSECLYKEYMKSLLLDKNKLLSVLEFNNGI